MDEGFAASEGGVSTQSAAPGSVESSPVESTGAGVSSGAGVMETPAGESKSGRTPKAARMIPETDLHKLRSVMDRKLSEISTQNQQYSEALQNMEQAMLRMRWEQLPPEQVKAEREELRRLHREETLRGRHAELSTMRSAMNEQARPMFAHHLAQRYGVAAEELLEFNDPVSMEAAARKLHLVQSRSQLQARKESGVDRMDGLGGGAGHAWDGLKGSSLLEWYYRNKR